MRISQPFGLLVIFVISLSVSLVLLSTPTSAAKIEVVASELKLLPLRTDWQSVGNQSVKRAFDGSLHPQLGLVTATGNKQGKIRVEFKRPTAVGSIAIWNEIGHSDQHGIDKFHVVFFDASGNEIYESRRFRTLKERQGDDSLVGFANERNGPDHFGFNRIVHDVAAAEVVIWYPHTGYRRGDHIEVREIAFYDTNKVDLYLFGGQSNASGVWTTSDIDIKHTVGDSQIQFTWNYPKDSDFEMEVNGPSRTDSYYKCNSTDDERNCSQYKWVFPRSQTSPRRPGILISHYGPEVSFARCAATNGKWQYLHKYAVPGQSLYQWVKDEHETTARYDDMVEQFKIAADQLKNNGLHPTLRAVVWIQGESDSTKDYYRSTYGERVNYFVENLRSALSEYQNPDCFDSQHYMQNVNLCAPVIFSLQEHHGTYEVVVDENGNRVRAQNGGFVTVVESNSAEIKAQLMEIKMAQETVPNSSFVSVENLRYKKESATDTTLQNNGWGDQFGHLTPYQIEKHGELLCDALEQIENR